MARSIVEKIPGFVALATATVMTISVMHDWGYFRAVDPDLFSLMTISDHLVSGIDWIPSTLITLIVGMGLLESRAGYSLYSSIYSSIRKPIVFWVFMLTLIAAIFLTGPSFSYFINLTMYTMIIALMVPRFTRNIGEEWDKEEIESMLYIFLFLAAVAFISGQRDGFNDLTKTESNYIITETSNIKHSNVILFRTLERGIIFGSLENG